MSVNRPSLDQILSEPAIHLEALTPDLSPAEAEDGMARVEAAIETLYNRAAETAKRANDQEAGSE